MIKAISLTQPWATLIAIRAKKIETRGWYTYYRGPLAIHSSSRMDDQARGLARTNRYFSEALERAGFRSPDDLPLGRIVAIAELVNVIRIAPFTELPPDPEFSFGNYSTGRYMFILDRIRPATKLVKVRGALGLWDFDETML